MWKLVQNYLFANNDMEIGNEEVKNPCPEVGSSEIAEGSQRDSIEYEENKALKEPSLRDSTQVIEQEDSQKEVRTDKCPTKKEPFNHKRKFEKKTKKRVEENEKQIY